MKCNQSRLGFKLVLPCPFPTTITITPRAPPQTNYCIINFFLDTTWARTVAYLAFAVEIFLRSRNLKLREREREREREGGELFAFILYFVGMMLFRIENWYVYRISESPVYRLKESHQEDLDARQLQKMSRLWDNLLSGLFGTLLSTWLLHAVFAFTKKVFDETTNTKFSCITQVTVKMWQVFLFGSFA